MTEEKRIMVEMDTEQFGDLIQMYQTGLDMSIQCNGSQIYINEMKLKIKELKQNRYEVVHSVPVPEHCGTICDLCVSDICAIFDYNIEGIRKHPDCTGTEVVMLRKVKE